MFDCGLYEVPHYLLICVYVTFRYLLYKRSPYRAISHAKIFNETKINYFRLTRKWPNLLVKESRTEHNNTIVRIILSVHHICKSNKCQSQNTITIRELLKSPSFQICYFHGNAYTIIYS